MRVVEDLRAGAHGIACEGVHVRARVEASRLACLKRLDSGRVWLRGADALCIQHAYVHAVAGGALVELRQHRAITRIPPTSSGMPRSAQYARNCRLPSMQKRAFAVPGLTL